MIPYFAVVLLIVACTLVARLTYVVRKQGTAALAAPAVPVPVIPAPGPKVPADTSRPYPRPRGGRRKLDRICPVCGTDDRTGSLDGRVLGWRAHRSCAEWLGDWRSASAALRTAESGLHCDGCGVPLGTGVRYHDTAGHHYCPACDRKGYGHQSPPAPAEHVWSQSGTTDPIVLIQQGVVSIDEAREHLDRKITAVFSVPPTALEQHTHKVGDPVPAVQCACGAVFRGTPEYLKEAMETHRQVGCRQSSPPPDRATMGG